MCRPDAAFPVTTKLGDCYLQAGQSTEREAEKWVLVQTARPTEARHLVKIYSRWCYTQAPIWTQGVHEWGYGPRPGLSSLRCCLLLSCFRTAQELECRLASVDLRHGLGRVADQSNGLVNADVKFHV